MTITGSEIMERLKFATRTIYLRSETQRDTLIQLARNLPLDKEKPLEIVVREKQKARCLDANSLMWAGPLKDISEQALFAGKKYSAEVWHHYFKCEFLPEPDFCDADLVKDGYKKWEVAPDGTRVLVGSTSDLTKRGFALYLTEIEAFGANLGVMYSFILPRLRLSARILA